MKVDYVESDSLQDLINFLLSPQSPPNQFRVTWDLEQFRPVIKKLGLEYLEKLYTTGRVWIKEFGYSITETLKRVCI